MGISIEQIIESLNYIKHIGNGEIEYRNCREAIALDMAVNIIHKYQQIRQIAFPLQFCSTDKLEHEAIMKICEVLEDGDDD